MARHQARDRNHLHNATFLHRTRRRALNGDEDILIIIETSISQLPIDQAPNMLY